MYTNKKNRKKLLILYDYITHFWIGSMYIFNILTGFLLFGGKEKVKEKVFVL